MSAHPAIVEMLRQQRALSPLQAVAAKLWLDSGGADPDGALGRALDAHWKAQPGADPYWESLAQRRSCDGCSETYRLENLALCPNCFRVQCPRHDRLCSCGHNTLG